jgi:hypothetical protein
MSLSSRAFPHINFHTDQYNTSSPSILVSRCPCPSHFNLTTPSPTLSIIFRKISHWATGNSTPLITPTFDLYLPRPLQYRPYPDLAPGLAIPHTAAWHTNGKVAKLHLRRNRQMSMSHLSEITNAWSAHRWWLGRRVEATGESHCWSEHEDVHKNR